MAAFVSNPTSVNATLGSTATFECSVTTGLIGWQVNGSLLSDLSAPNISISQVGRTRFLHIPATEEYNNTVVVCILAIVGGDDLYSDPAVLQVQGTLFKRVFITRLLDSGIIVLDMMRQLNPIISVNR